MSITPLDHHNNLQAALIFADELKEELERVQKQAAAMREALVSIAEDKALVAFGHNANPMASRLGGIAAAALEPDAGREFISREQVKPLVVALKEAAQCRFFYLESMDVDDGAHECVMHALAHARTLGFDTTTRA